MISRILTENSYINKNVQKLFMSSNFEPFTYNVFDILKIKTSEILNYKSEILSKQLLKDDILLKRSSKDDIDLMGGT